MTDATPSHALPTTHGSSVDVNAREKAEAEANAVLPTTYGSSVDVHHVRLEQKRFLAVYAVLIVGTVLTVAMYYVHFEEMWQTIAVALGIAAVKGSFVAAVFMHLWHGERDIYKILLYTGVVVVALFGLSIFSIFNVPGTGHFL